MQTGFINTAIALRNESLLKTEALFATQRQAWFAAFSEHFQLICADIVKLQAESFLPAISYMDYTMLYTNFINRRYVAEVWVYGDEWYCDKNQRMAGEYDLSFLFVCFNELWDRLLSERKRYVGKVTAQEVTAFMMRALPDFFSYLINIARFAITDSVDKNPFADIKKNDVFRINTGDYMAGTEPVFTVKKVKNADTLAEWFSERLENEYTFEDYSCLDFSGRSFTFTEFRYSQFRHSRLNNASLEGSALIGASFYRARMENCRLDNCSVYEADFSYATLKNASFAFARGRAGLPNEKEWKHVGFLPVSFRRADLTGASFKHADLTGADFTGAVLTGADFTGAVLDGAVFDSGTDWRG